MNCASNHRALGPQISFVRSTVLDKWTLKQLIVMKIGGNGSAGELRKNSHTQLKDAKTFYASNPASNYREKLAESIDNWIEVNDKSGIDDKFVVASIKQDNTLINAASSSSTLHGSQKLADCRSDDSFTSGVASKGTSLNKKPITSMKKTKIVIKPVEADFVKSTFHQSAHFEASPQKTEEPSAAIAESVPQKPEKFSERDLVAGKLPLHLEEKRDKSAAPVAATAAFAAPKSSTQKPDENADRLGLGGSFARKAASAKAASSSLQYADSKSVSSSTYFDERSYYSAATTLSNDTHSSSSANSAYDNDVLRPFEGRSAISSSDLFGTKSTSSSEGSFSDVASSRRTSDSLSQWKSKISHDLKEAVKSSGKSVCFLFLQFLLLDFHVS